MGTVFKKSYFDPLQRIVVSKCVNPSDLVVNYYTNCDVNEAPRVTHYFTLTRNDIHQRVVEGYYSDFESWANNPGLSGTAVQEVADKRQGITAPAPDAETTPIGILEQLCWFDLDGDGYAEPYVVTAEEGTGRVRRMVARFLPSDVKYARGRGAKKVVACITPTPIYTRYELIPAPDGGFYGLGFGRLLGPINESVNTMLNQLIDAGTLSNYGGGFLGRGARFRGGQYTFKPQEWKQVDAPGDDLRKNIVPLMVREPSAILFQLMTFLVGYGERVASANDLQMGENIGQNTPAETARVMNQNGARVFSAIYKRNWRAQRDEYRVRYELNKVYIEADADYENMSTGAGATIYADDFQGSSTDVRPAADPTMVDDTQKIANADFIMGLAFKVPGFNRYWTTRRVLEARNITDIDEIFPVPAPAEGVPEGALTDIPSPPDPKMMEIQIKQGKLQLEQQAFQLEQQRFAAEMQNDVIELQTGIQLKQAQIYELQAKATKELAEAKGVETGHMVGILQTQMSGLENEIRMMELKAQKAQGRVDMILGAMKIEEKRGDIQHKRLTQATQRGKQEADARMVAPPIDPSIQSQPGIFGAGDATGVVE
jgi:chaperonin GroES